MRIRMLETAPGAPDGLHVHQYDKGQEYDEHSCPPMSDALADVLIRGDLAVEVKPIVAPVEAQSQALTRAPEAQAAGGAPETQVRKRTGAKK